MKSGIANLFIAVLKNDLVKFRVLVPLWQNFSH